MFTGGKVFWATKAKERDDLGEQVARSRVRAKGAPGGRGGSSDGGVPGEGASGDGPSRRRWMRWACRASSHSKARNCLFRLSPPRRIPSSKAATPLCTFRL